MRRCVPCFTSKALQRSRPGTLRVRFLLAWLGATTISFGVWAGPPSGTIIWAIGATIKWDQSHPASTTTATDDDGFGSAIALGDFDGNGALDLAAGMPYKLDQGEVLVVLRTSDRGWLPGSHVLSQDWPNTPGVAEAGDLFGSSLVAGDFDCDGVDDLAVGSPGETIEGATDVISAGAVNVFYGDPSPVLRFQEGNQIFHQAVGGVQGVAEFADQFGSVLGLE